jgi:hypothetical protein
MMSFNLERRQMTTWGAAALAAGFWLLGDASAAHAKGMVRVQQADGSVQEYPNVTIKLVRNKALYLTTEDGKGTLVVYRAACSLVDKIQRCLPYSAELAQGGTTKPLDFKDGTVYGNLTDTKQTLPFSSTELPPNGILMLFKTKIGTYVTASGTIDEIKQ